MSRPRIRTLKPDAPRDERVGRLSRDARLLFFTGLVALADDEGRLRAMPSAIIGDVFPYDDDVTPAKLRRWLGEIEAEQLILSYEADGVQYLAIRHWKRHQRINRPSPSVLPPPPDQSIVTENSVSDHGRDGEDSVDDHEVLTTDSDPRAQARVPLHSTPEESNGPTRPRPREAAAVVTFNRRPVPASRLSLAEQVLADFNAQAGTSLSAYTASGKSSDSLGRIIGALTEYPDDLADLDACRRVTTAALKSGWFNGPANVGVVFGPGVVQQNIERAKTAGPRRTNVADDLDRAYGRTAG